MIADQIARRMTPLCGPAQQLVSCCWARDAAYHATRSTERVTHQAIWGSARRLGGNLRSWMQIVIDSSGVINMAKFSPWAFPDFPLAREADG